MIPLGMMLEVVLNVVVMEDDKVADEVADTVNEIMGGMGAGIN